MERDISPGARALREYVDREFEGSISRFCRERGLDRVQVARIMNGTRGQRMTVTFAKVIEDASGGEVPVSVWANEDPETTDPARVA